MKGATPAKKPFDYGLLSVIWFGLAGADAATTALSSDFAARLMGGTVTGLSIGLGIYFMILKILGE